MWRTVGTAGFVGIEILLSFAVGYLGGQWLDGKLGTTPWLKWIGTAAGLGAAIKALVVLVRNYNRSISDQDRANQDRANQDQRAARGAAQDRPTAPPQDS